MTFKPVNEVPNRKRAARHDLKSILTEFVEGDKKIVQVVFIKDDYKCPMYGYKSLYCAARNYKLPVKVHWRDGEVYLTKK